MLVDVFAGVLKSKYQYFNILILGSRHAKDLLVRREGALARMLEQVATYVEEENELYADMVLVGDALLEFSAMNPILEPMDADTVRLIIGIEEALRKKREKMLAKVLAATIVKIKQEDVTTRQKGRVLTSHILQVKLENHLRSFYTVTRYDRDANYCTEGPYAEAKDGMGSCRDRGSCTWSLCQAKPRSGTSTPYTPLVLQNMGEEVVKVGVIDRDPDSDSEEE